MGDWELKRVTLEVEVDVHTTCQNGYHYFKEPGTDNTFTIGDNCVKAVDDVPWQVEEGDVYLTEDGVYVIISGMAYSAGAILPQDPESIGFKSDELIHREV